MHSNGIATLLRPRIVEGIERRFNSLSFAKETFLVTFRSSTSNRY